MSITNELREQLLYHTPAADAALQRLLDRIDETVASGYVMLPRDADGVPIRVGDVMETEDNRIRKVDTMQISSRKWSIGLVTTLDNAFSWHDANRLRHHHEQAVEDVLREFAKCWDDPVHYAKGELVETFAEKLRLADGGEEQ